MKDKIMTALVIAATAIIVIQGIMWLSDKLIRARIVQLTPIGTSMEEIQRLEREIPSWEYGGLTTTEDGEIIFRANIRRYVFKPVRVHWRSDKDSKLIDIYIQTNFYGY